MSFTAQEMKDLRVVFDVYDPSKSGFITIGDVRKVSDSKSQGILKLPKAVILYVRSRPPIVLLS